MIIENIKGTENIFCSFQDKLLDFTGSASWCIGIQTQNITEDYWTGAVFPSVGKLFPSFFLVLFLSTSFFFVPSFLSLYFFCLLGTPNKTFTKQKLIMSWKCSYIIPYFSFTYSIYILPLKAPVSFTKYQPGVSVENGKVGPEEAKSCGFWLREVRIC